MLKQGSIRSGCRWWTAEQPLFAASEVWSLITLLSEQCYDPRQLFPSESFAFDELFDPAKRLNLKQMAGFYTVAARHGWSENILPLGRRLHLSTFGVPGFAVLSASRLRDALATIARFAPLLNLSCSIVIEQGGRIGLRMDPCGEIDPGAEGILFAKDVVKLRTFLKDLLGPSYEPLALLFNGRESSCEEVVEAIRRSGADPASAAPRVTIVLQPGLELRPLLQAHPASHERAVEDCDRVLESLRAKADIESVIKSHLRSLDIKVPTFTELSRNLRLSERTLRRRLERTGTSYSRILDEMREELAASLLVVPGRTTEEIAERLGYSDAANFRHAFKRWTGEAPSAFRMRVRRAEDTPSCI